MIQRKNNKSHSVFIHIPRTGGTYLKKSLRIKKLSSLGLVKRRFKQKGHVSFGHQDYLSFVKTGFVNKEFDDGAFKFTFCRNPFDWVVSHYFWTTTNFKSVFTEEISFLEHTRMFEKMKTPKGMGRSFPYENWLRPQYEHIKGIDFYFIGRFETLDKDVDMVADILGITTIPTEPAYPTIHLPYREYYNDESIKNVREFYEKDFEFFGYSLELA